MPGGCGEHRADYLAMDVKPGFAYYYGDWIDVDLIGGGLRVMPLGTRLEGFYIVTRVQTFYPCR